MRYARAHSLPGGVREGGPERRRYNMADAPAGLRHAQSAIPAGAAVQVHTTDPHGATSHIPAESQRGVHKHQQIPGPHSAVCEATLLPQPLRVGVQLAVLSALESIVTSTTSAMSWPTAIVRAVMM